MSRQITRFLAKVHGFDSLDRKGRRAFGERMRECSFRAGTRVLRRGGTGGGMHVIRDGSVRIPILDAEGRQKFEARLGPGAIVGEIAMLTGMPRTADVIAERLVRLRYPASAEDSVDDACRSLERQLADVEGADVAWAQLPVGGIDTGN